MEITNAPAHKLCIMNILSRPDERLMEAGYSLAKSWGKGKKKLDERRDEERE